MNIYLISQTVNNGYDTYDSAVVIAKSEEEAKTIHPDGEVNNESMRRYGTWAPPCHVIVEKIGIVDSDITEQRVICASFNAG